jgi:hypothetical protein
VQQIVDLLEVGGATLQGYLFRYPSGGAKSIPPQVAAKLFTLFVAPPPPPPIKQPAALPDTVPACHELIQQLLQDLDVLRERVSLNSRNSSKPPSSDGPQTPPRTPKVQSGKRLGGQLGHKGSFRALVSEDQLTSKVLCPPPP